jgi:hypothetical protein
MSMIDSSTLLKSVLSDAVRRTFSEIGSGEGAAALEAVRKAWLRCLRDAFGEQYKRDDRFAVFGGKPMETERRKDGVPTGVWKGRWEFLYDVAVLKMDEIDAAYAHGRKVPLATQAIWLVESEIAGDGNQVAEDASKLRIANSENTLLIAARTTQGHPEKWLDFLGKCMSGIGGNVFIALVPSYSGGSSASGEWRNKQIEIALYRCASGTPVPQEIASFVIAGQEFCNQAGVGPSRTQRDGSVARSGARS